VDTHLARGVPLVGGGIPLEKRKILAFCVHLLRNIAVQIPFPLLRFANIGKGGATPAQLSEDGMFKAEKRTVP
jgi:hypothetical protein